MGDYQSILEDLLRTMPADIEPYPPLYAEDATSDAKFAALNEAIIQSKRIGSRTLLLVNVFYLGQFLERTVRNNLQRNYYA